MTDATNLPSTSKPVVEVAGPGRRQFLKSAAAISTAAAISGVAAVAPAVLAQTKRFQGTTINVSCWNSTYAQLIGEYVKEFTELTGIKVAYDLPGFPVYNQRADLELLGVDHQALRLSVLCRFSFILGCPPLGMARRAVADI